MKKLNRSLEEVTSASGDEPGPQAQIQDLTPSDDNESHLGIPKRFDMSIRRHLDQWELTPGCSLHSESKILDSRWQHGGIIETWYRQTGCCLAGSAHALAWHPMAANLSRPRLWLVVVWRQCVVDRSR